MLATVSKVVCWPPPLRPHANSWAWAPWKGSWKASCPVTIPTVPRPPSLPSTSVQGYLHTLTADRSNSTPFWMTSTRTIKKALQRAATTLLSSLKRPRETVSMTLWWRSLTWHLWPWRPKRHRQSNPRKCVARRPCLRSERKSSSTPIGLSICARATSTPICRCPHTIATAERSAPAWRTRAAPRSSRLHQIICDEEPLFEACTEEVYLGPPLCYSMSISKRPTRHGGKLIEPLGLPSPAPSPGCDEYQKAHGISQGSVAGSQPECHNEAPYLILYMWNPDRYCWMFCRY